MTIAPNAALGGGSRGSSGPTSTPLNGNGHTLASDPLRSFKFNVFIPIKQSSSIQSQGWARMGFMSVSGLGMAIEPLTYREGGDNLTDLPLDARVLTFDGWKAMGELCIGDRVLDPDGEDSKITNKSQVTSRQVYRLVLGDGTVAEASDRHVWEVEVVDSNDKRLTLRLRTDEIKRLVENKNRRVLLRAMRPFNFDVAPELPIDPYLLGLLLAEGSLEAEGVSLAATEPEIIARAAAALPAGHRLVARGNAFRISVGNTGGAQSARNVPGRNIVLSGLRDLGLLGHRAWEKFIPALYLRASVEDRIELLRGLMDGDGWVDERHCVQFASSSKRLTEDMKELIGSLGGRAGKITHKAERTYWYKGDLRACRDSWSFAGVADIDFVPFHLQRKIERFRVSPKTGSQFRRIRSVEPVGEKDVQCIEVSAPSHLFVHDGVYSSNTRKMPGQADVNPITLSRGLFYNAWDNWYWFTNLFTAIYGGQQGGWPAAMQGSMRNFRTHIYINVLQHPNNTGSGIGAQNPQSGWPQQNGQVQLSIKLYAAWIMSYAFSDFDAGGNAVAVEQMQLAYEGFDVRWGGAGGGTYVANPFTWS